MKTWFKSAIFVTLSFCLCGCKETKKTLTFDSEDFGRTRAWLHTQTSALDREQKGKNETFINRELTALNQSLDILSGRKVAWPGTIISVSNDLVELILQEDLDAYKVRAYLDIRGTPSILRAHSSVEMLNGIARGGYTRLYFPISKVPEEIRQMRQGASVVFEAEVQFVAVEIRNTGWPLFLIRVKDSSVKALR